MDAPQTDLEMAGRRMRRGQELQPNLMGSPAAGREVNQPVNSCADEPGRGLAAPPRQPLTAVST